MTDPQTITIPLHPFLVLETMIPELYQEAQAGRCDLAQWKQVQDALSEARWQGVAVCFLEKEREERECELYGVPKKHPLMHCSKCGEFKGMDHVCKPGIPAHTMVEDENGNRFPASEGEWTSEIVLGGYRYNFKVYLHGDSQKWRAIRYLDDIEGSLSYWHDQGYRNWRKV